MRRVRGSAVAVLVLLLGAACGSGGPGGSGGSGPRSTSEPSGLLRAQGVVHELPPANAPVAQTVDGITSFGYRFVQQIATPTANLVVSPLSIEYAFAQARVGARGDTARQLDKVFGFPAGADDAFNALTRQLVTVDGAPLPRPSHPADQPAAPTVSIANATFLQQGTTVEPAFLNTLATKFGSGVRPVDFASGQGSQAIDDWARVATAGRITHVFSQLDRSTVLVLANAVYFGADWNEPFYTLGDQPFTRADGSTVQVPTMMKRARVRHAESADWQAVEIPYAHSEYAMWILLPQQGSPPATLLSPQTLDAVGQALTTGPDDMGVDISLPRWNVETRPELMPALHAMGLSATSDFSGISPGLVIDQVVHAANITVGETGTEAAAVTAVGFAVSAVPSFHANRPFAFAIIHKPTQTPLFIGQVVDPTA